MEALILAAMAAFNATAAEPVEVTFDGLTGATVAEIREYSDGKREIVVDIPKAKHKNVPRGLLRDEVLALAEK